MIKGYSAFINENSDWNKAKEIHEKLMIYLVNRINKETENLSGNPIKINLDDNFNYDHDEGDDTKGWLYCRFDSERLSCEPDGDPIDDHIQLIEDSLKGLKAVESIIEELENSFSIVIYNQIKNGGRKGRIGILTNIELAYIHNNEKLDNFLNSQKGIDKFRL